MKDNVIGTGKSKEFSKSPWECKVKKRAEEAQGKQTGLGRLRENKWDIEARLDVIKEPMVILDHWEKNKRQA